MAVQIDTGAVALAAQEIAALNSRINQDFSDMESAVQRLSQGWRGNASADGVDRFRHIKLTFFDSRYRVVNQVVTFLQQQVGAGYEETEKAVSSAADAFK